MSKTPVGLHVFWEEEGLLQGLGDMTCMPPTVMPNEGIPSNGYTVHLQFRRPYACWTAYLSHRKLFSAVSEVGPPTSLVLRLPLLFASFWRAYLTLLKSLLVSLPPQLRNGLWPEVNRKLRRGRWRVHWGLDLLAS